MNNSYKLRSALIFLSFCALYSIILFNLYLIQIKRNAFFVELGEKQYTSLITTNPPRAPIYDRTGTQCLALNKDSVAAFILPKKLSEPDTLKPFLKKHFPQAYARLRDHANSHFMYISRRLSTAQIDLIAKSGITDIQLLNEPNRFYPISCAGQIIGITDIDNKGLFGLELFLNHQLAGTPTTYSLERDARSGRYYFKRRTAVEGKEGQAVYLTIDSDLQFLAHEELQQSVDQFQAKEGAVIIMNPATGEILAMTSAPDFDPNNTKHIVMEHTKNKIITEEYEAGSVIKICGALAAIEEGVVTVDELIDCENVPTAYIDGRKVNTVKSSVAGIIPFSEVLAKSNNIGMAKVIKRLGTKLYDHYIRLGFGKKTGIEFPGERSGFVNPPHAWSKQSLFSLSYGYEITATLLQVANVFCMIANNGHSIRPTLIMNTPPQLSAKPLYSADTLTTIEQLLENNVLQGTAKKARINGYRIMSKTGTANLLVDGEYSKTRNIYTCAGIVEKGKYKRVIVAFIKESPLKNLYASMVAVPLFERVAEKMLIHDKVL